MVCEPVLFLAMVVQAFVHCCRSMDPGSRRSMNVSQGSLELQRPGGSKKVMDREAEVSHLLSFVNICWYAQHEGLSQDLRASAAGLFPHDTAACSCTVALHSASLDTFRLLLSMHLGNRRIAVCQISCRVQKQSP